MKSVPHLVVTLLFAAVLWPAAAAAQLTAQITYPANGATNADLSQPIQWTTVTNAQAYQLYIGSTAGAKDILDSRQTQATSFLATNVPPNQVVYARIWVQVGGVWRYADSSFSGAPLTTRIMYPADGAINTDIAQPIQWLSIPNAQAYELYLGSSPGARDWLDSGQLQTTSRAWTNVPTNQTVYARIWVEVGGVWRHTDSSFSGARFTTQITYPPNGATNADVMQPIQWIAVTNAQGYQLYIGSTPGAKDLLDSRQIQTTSFAWTNVPPNQTLYARIWVKVGGVWRYTDSSFSGARLTTQITYPANGAVNADITQSIQWLAVSSAQAYQLWVGSAAGGYDLLRTAEIQATSYPWSSLPANQTVYARIWMKVGGVWRYTDSSFSGARLTTQITYPANGATDADLAQPIQWLGVANAQSYELYLGTSPGSRDILDTRQVQTTSVLASNVPANQTIYARIWVQVGGVWRSTDSTFSGAPLTTRITYPANGATNADMSLPIQWASIPNAQAYVLWLGSTAGTHDLVTTSEALQTSYLASNLPANQAVYALIWAKVGGVWRSADSTFSPGSFVSTITVPIDGATNVDRSQPITWTSIPGAQAYVLWIGSTMGSRNLASSLEGMQTSFVASSLPPNQRVYARLWTKAGGVWRSADSSFTIAPVTATMIYPADGATHVDSAQPFSWTTALNAQAYFLWVGTALDTHDVASSGDLTQTSYAISGLPAGASVLYVTIWTRVGGVWYPARTTFQPLAVTAATFLNPLDGQTNVDLSQAVQWTSVASDAYQLFLGSQQGSSDFLETTELHQTSYLASQLPAGGTVYARLRTRIGSMWWYQDVSFSAIPYAPRFVYPAQGATGVDPGHAFEWTASQGADAYRLWIGTTPGASDLVSTGALTATSYTVTSLPTDRTLYGRIYSRVAGHFSRYSDVAFTLATSSLQATIVYPPEGSTGADGGRPFEWSGTDLAQAYRLRVGTTAGASDLHDSGEIRITRRFVDALPIGTPLFGRLSTKLEGQWYDSDFTFSLATNVTTTATRISNGLWATNVVRGMTPPLSNRPYRWTPLWDSIDALKYEASCGSYTLVLRWVLEQMNLGLQVRSTMIRFSLLDVHIFVEILDSDTNHWMVLDPTFGLAATRTSGGGWASAADIAQATVAQDWSAIGYVFLAAQGDAVARGYYLDYPLLYLNDFVAGSPWHAATPYMTAVLLPASGPYSVYIAACDNGSQADVLISGNVQTIQCASDGLSGAFLASSVDAAPGSSSTFHLFRPRRFIF